ncbi:immunoglobulin-like domain-containing protein [Methanolobus sp.]|uniref:immunoglobulin-like domain-containing protein n=1 Tax=Methanolobus sp. TaxID=1874737 RepID=UPI00273145E7|nr:immunoglobulin-like domain-containing protein [Methanolobus sp.]
MGKKKMMQEKNSKRKWIPVVSIALVAFFVFFAGCLDNEPGNEDTNGELIPGAVIEMSQNTFGMSDLIEFDIRNTGNTNLMFGRNFDIEFYNASIAAWEPVEMDMVVTMDMIILAPGEVFTQGFTPEEVFVDEIEEGQYRIKKAVSVAETDESMELEKTFMIETGSE